MFILKRDEIVYLKKVGKI